MISSRSLLAGICAVLAASIFISSSSSADEADVSAKANGAVSLEAPPSPAPPSLPDLPLDSESEPPSAEAQISSGESVAAQIQDEASPNSASEMEFASSTPIAPPVNESKALGVPNGPLSARPVTSSEGDGDGAQAGSLLTKLDPRSNDLMRVLGALAIVIGLLVLCRVFMKRMGGMFARNGRPSGVIEILARYPIARNQSLIVMKVARRVLILHHAGTSMRTLSEIADPDEVAGLLGRMEAGSRSRDAVRFRETLRSFERDHDRASTSTVAPVHDQSRGEIIDLTRSPIRGFGSLLGGRKLLN